MSSELLRELTSRPWRGNVRELRNFVDRARALGAAEALAMTFERNTPAARNGANPASASLSLSPAALAIAPTLANLPPPTIVENSAIFEQNYRDFRESWVDRGEKEYVRQLLLRHDRSVASAAREAEVDRTYIYRLIRKHDL